MHSPQKYQAVLKAGSLRCACCQGNGDSQQPSSMPGGHSMPGGQSMQGMQSMAHLSSGLMTGLQQHPHIPSLDASAAPFHHQAGAGMQAAQAAPMHHFSMPPQHSGALPFGGRPPMVCHTRSKCPGSHFCCAQWNMLCPPDANHRDVALAGVRQACQNTLWHLFVCPWAP